MATNRSPTARSKLDPPDPPVPEPQPQFLEPSIWWKSPDEHIREDHHARRLRQSLLPHFQYGTPLRKPPPGHIRLLFWWSLDELKTPRPKAQVSADIVLDPDGSLDLLAVQKLWGLETVAIIHPLRWTIFEPGDPNRLSALAIHDLSIDRHIFITEHPATQETMVKRTLRLLCMDLYFLSIFGLYRLIVQGGYGPKQRVPVPEWYDDTVVLRNSIVYQMKGLKREMGATCKSMLSYGSRLVGSSAPAPATQDSQARSTYQWLDRFETSRKHFAGHWGGFLLIFLGLFFLCLVDHFIIHLF